MYVQTKDVCGLGGGGRRDSDVCLLIVYECLCILFVKLLYMFMYESILMFVHCALHTIICVVCVCVFPLGLKEQHKLHSCALLALFDCSTRHCRYVVND